MDVGEDELTCRLRPECRLDDSYRPGSLESCRSQFCTDHSVHLQTLPDSDTVRSAGRTDLPPSPVCYIDTAGSLGKDRSSRFPEHISRTRLPLSGGDRHSARCPGHRHGRAPCRENISYILGMRCPSNQPGRRHTWDLPLRACRHIGQSRHRSCHVWSPSGHSHI